MNELDRRIAVEIMAIKEPLPPLVFRPPPYSTSYEHAMKALNTYQVEWKKRNPARHGKPMWCFNYMPDAKKNKQHYVKFWDVGIGAYGATLPEAICNLLLALKEKL